MAATTFHAGEVALQKREGSFERMDQAGPRVIRDHMPEQHREFFALLPWLLAGSVDDQGQPWASVLCGPPGFAHSPQPRSLRVDALPAPQDPLAANLQAGRPLGLLGIQPHTRRRNRMNGSVAALDAGGFTVAVGQSFGNCPKYIQAREPLYDAALAAPAAPRRLDALDADARRLIARADTFFIATAHPGAGADGQPALGVDVSHRGGPPGFVQVDESGELRVPDYTGNAFFNTLGNLQLEPRCGLLFIDFDSGELLQLSAHASLHWADAAPAAPPVTARRLRLRVLGGLRRAGALPLRWR